MDDKEIDKNPTQRRHRDRGRAWMGLILLIIGGTLLTKQFGFIFPDWVYTWPMLLIVIGLFIGAKHNFRDIGWLIMVGIGGLFLMEEIHPEMGIYHFVWPVVIIGAGLMLLLRPRHSRHGRWRGKNRRYDNQETFEHADQERSSKSAYSGEDVIDVVSIFSNVKKMVLSKNFRGGETVCIFGGCEINIAQADIAGPIVIDAVNIFGGTKLIIPSNWEVRSEAIAIFGGVEDKRQQPAGTDPQPGKVLILEGAAIFGGIEITSY